jgi:asparagine synthase (glutamine-hydrolysing)
VLPAEILTRPKMGFPVPVGSWFRGEYAAVVEEYLLSERAMDRGIFNPAFVRTLVQRHQAGENHAERLWALVNFEMWQRQFFDNDRGSAVEESQLEFAHA